ncbi:MAG: DUF3343 domain-containing protein [Lachnospiraceae bacterium]|nr:DUF3343 domain-containing protein [Lachnospiraceae bacterium]
MDYTATFYSHFGAMRFKKEIEEAGGNARLMPVPRFLSSSCGTCCAFAADALPTPSHPDEIEQIVKMTGDDSYEVVFSNL